MPQSQMCNDLIGIRSNHGYRPYHTSASGKESQYHFVHAIVISVNNHHFYWTNTMMLRSVTIYMK